MINKLRELKKHQGFLKYFNNTSWLFGEKLFRILVGLFISAWIIRYLGPEQFGLLSYAQSIVALVAVIAGMGLDGIVIRELVKDESKRDVLLGTSFILKIIGSIIVIILITITTIFSSFDNFTSLLIIIIASATIFRSFNVIDMYFQSKVLSRYVVMVSSIHLFISSIVKIYMIVSNKALIYFASVIVVDSFLLAIGLIIVYHKFNLVLWNWKFDKQLAKKLLKDSWPMIFSASAIVLYSETDKIMIKAFLGVQDVGIYSAASLLIISLSFIPNLINQSIYPKIIHYTNSNKNGVFNMERLFSFMFIIALIITSILFLLKEYIFIILYGHEYIESANVFGILIFTLVFIFFRITSSKWYLANNLTFYFAIFNFIGAVINIIFNFYLIKTFGINGAAYASLIAFMCSVLILPLFYSKTRDMSISMIMGMINTPKNILTLLLIKKEN